MLLGKYGFGWNFRASCLWFFFILLLLDVEPYMNSNGSITDLTAYANDIIIVETKTFYYQTTTIIIFRTIENGLHWDGHWTKCLLKLLKIRHFVSNDFQCKQYSHTHTSIRTSTVCLCRHTCRFLSWVTRDDVDEKKECWWLYYSSFPILKIFNSGFIHIILPLLSHLLIK